MNRCRPASGLALTQLKGTLYVGIMPQSEPRIEGLQIATFWRLNKENLGLVRGIRLSFGQPLAQLKGTLYVAIML